MASIYNLFTRFFYCLLGFLTSTSTLAQEPVTLAIDNWQPLFDEQAEGYGLFAQIVTRSFAAQGVTVNYVFCPWSRALLKAIDGEVDGTPGWTITPDREQQFHYSDSVMELSGVFFHLTKNPLQWQSVADLKGKIIGGTIGYNYGDLLETAAYDGTIIMDRVSTDAQNLKKLVLGRIELFPQVLEVGYDQIRTHLSPEEAKLITHHPKPYRHTTYHLMLSKSKVDNARLISLFNAGLRELKESGQYAQIIAASQRP